MTPAEYLVRVVEPALMRVSETILTILLVFAAGMLIVLVAATIGLRIRRRFTAQAAMLALTASCAASDQTDRTGAVGVAPAEVLLTATDGALQAPDTVPAGWTTLRLVNQGNEPHMAQLIRLDDGRTVEDLLQYYSAPFEARGPRPSWMKLLGGPTAVGPQGTGNATQYLEPGSYVLGDFVDLGDGIPNLLQGMAHAFVVPATSSAASAATPPADVVVRLLDYSFSLDRPLTGGRQVIRVDHAGAEPHEIILARLAPGKTVADVAAWTQTFEGPPPLTLGGGLGALNSGASAYFEVDLTPGEYVLFCLIPAPDGRLHTAHGMIQQLHIAEGTGSDASDPPNVVTVTATEYGLDAPDTVTAGYTSLRVVNHGDQPHMAALVRLDGGKSLREYSIAYGEARRTGSARPSWATHHGGTLAMPHGEAGAIVHLEPGHYAWVCFVTGPNNVSHLLEHGQGHEFVVRAPPGGTATPSAPEPTLTLRMMEYGFELEPALTAGRQIIRVENAGLESHHVMIFKLAPGKTQADLVAWLGNSMQGEAPISFARMMTVVAPGADAYLEADLSPGAYVLVCIVDGPEGVPHVAKGMLRQVTID
ncbi:MAG TPA: hypothetical protein VF178_04125 [Gemmatimonadaceae bacterium]